MLAGQGKGLLLDSSLDRICSADLLSPILVPRLLLSPLIAHDALIGSMAAPSSVGVGLTWASPFGALTVNYAVPLTKAAYDVVQPLSFGAGGF